MRLGNGAPKLRIELCYRHNRHFFHHGCGNATQHIAYYLCHHGKCVGGGSPGRRFTPGLVTAVFLILMNTGIAIKSLKVPAQTFSAKKVLSTGLSGLPALLAPAIILGGIFLGTFTPTEASAIAFIYALILGFFFYKELNLKKIYQVLYEGGRTSGIVALELAAGLLFANLMTLEGIPSILVEMIMGVNTHPMVIMMGISAILLLAACS